MGKVVWDVGRGTWESNKAVRDLHPTADRILDKSLRLYRQMPVPTL